MHGNALRYPFQDGVARDASTYATAAVLASFVLARFATGLWPSWTAVLPGLLAAVPASLFVGHLAVVLRDTASGTTEPTEFLSTAARLGLAVRVFAVVAAYLLVPGAIVAGGGYLIASETVPVGAVGLVASIVATVALLVVVTFTYLVPGAVAVGVQNGVRDALRRSAVRGLASGSYFVAWTGSAVLLVLGWGAVSFTGSGTIGGILAVVWLSYTHLAAARLLGLGLARVRER